MAAAARIWASLDAFVEGGAVLGRRVANSTFLTALLRADPYDAYHFFLQDEAAVRAQRAWLAETFPALEARGAFFTSTRLNLPEHLAQTAYHCFHLSDPITHAAKLMTLRNTLAATIFPVTSLTHSLSYVRFMADFFKLLWPGVSAKDALFVTSRSAHLVMERVFTALRQGYALDEAVFPAPALRQMPLGVDERALPGDDEKPGGSNDLAAQELLQRLGIRGRVVILSLARFSPVDKMDCLPLFAALRRAHDLGLAKEKYALLLAGWAEKDDALPQALAMYARRLGIEVRLVLRPSDAERRTLYAAADIFVSPADNIQETFGLTVAEAQLAGLPVVAADFDGYRDIVEHEVSGILVPTLGFAQSALSQARSLFWFDNQYLFGLAQQTAIHVPDMAQALARLGTDFTLRKSMGRAARQKAKRFAWPAVIQAMCALWDELAAQELLPEELARLRASSHPQTMRFAEFFQGHFTALLSDDFLENTILQRTAAGEALYSGALPVPKYAGLDQLLDEQLLRRALLAARKPVRGKDLLALLLEAKDKETQKPCPPCNRTFSQSYALPASPPGALPSAPSGGPSAMCCGALPFALAQEQAAFVLLWAIKQDYLEPVSSV